MKPSKDGLPRPNSDGHETGMDPGSNGHAPHPGQRRSPHT